MLSGFFATAGAAGVDFGMNSRDERDVHMGGFIGIAIAIIFTAGMAMLIVAGAYGKQDIAAAAAKDGKITMDAFNLIPYVLGAEFGKWVLFLLAISAFPAACFCIIYRREQFQAQCFKGQSVYIGGYWHGCGYPAGSLRVGGAV